ncbi:hypothetical protein P3X46_009571 [Hevea brasiliensis]|uniref:Apple domain-containing protein n=2 Tax=Hevea brasiliensis TaxID=3981 RepID=A0ABQ9MMB5_HEVBR|nr:hypothetical protein P3X46_009571 [Hevea brasiliensis]
MGRPFNSVNGLRATQLLFIIPVLFTSTWPNVVAVATQELLVGFRASPSPSVSSFQSLLNDSTGNFSMGFLRVNRLQLALTVIHLPSLQPLWQVNPTALARWSDRTELFFNGSLVISDPHSELFWSTGTLGDKVVLLNTSNLQIQRLEASPSVVWQSFDFPTDTLVENQNLTSNMSLVSSNGLYSLHLGDTFMALYAKFEENTQQMYWKRKALEARAVIVEGQGPILARVESSGFLGMFQTGNAPVDVQPFNSYQQPINRFLLVRLESDGNLKGYFWDGSTWALDYQAISAMCDLPSPCGSYGLCKPGSGCSCLDNRTEFSSGECLAVQSGHLCSNGEAKTKIDFRVLRRKGVDLPFKELMGYKTVSSLEHCEGLCENNCSCWGAVYNNASGFCYLVDYPIRTLLAVGDETKAGYFKLRKATGRKMDVGVGVGILSGAMAILVGAIGFGIYRIWKRRRGVKRILVEEDGISPGPYKDLGSASFRSIEMGTM